MRKRVLAAIVVLLAFRGESARADAAATVGRPFQAVVFREASEGVPAGEATKGPAPPRDVSPLVASILERHEVPGMVGAIVDTHGVVAIGAAGVRRRGSPEKVTVNDRFHIGSCTKSMTATLCGMLVEEGKLSWQTTLAQAFPELADSMRPEFRPVTLEQLLAHRGGAPANLDRDGLWGRLRRHQGTPTEARRLLLEGVVAGPPECEPGTKYVYSNAGYAIAGHMAETAAGKAWEDLMRERLFEPLGMTSAGFGAPGTKDALDQPRGHTASGKPVEPGPLADNPPAIGPAGRVHCTVGDWAKYISLHLRRGEGEPRILKPAMFDKLHTPLGDDARYALGWLVVPRNWGGGDVLTHTGSNTMWFAVAWLAPKRGFAVLVACNQGGKDAERACDEAAWALIQDFSLGGVSRGDLGRAGATGGLPAGAG
jgi:CubicO group peptidase (beta-lactamase class C family)